MSETEAERQQREEEFSQRMKRDGDLSLRLCEYIWNQCGDSLRLDGEDYEVLGDEDVPPGYEDDQYAVLLRRTSDGLVFDAEIDVSMHPVREATDPDYVAEQAAEVTR
jgi:hypothetical protein